MQMYEINYNFGPLTLKIYSYAGTSNKRWLPIWPIRKSLPNAGNGRETGPRNLRIRLQGKDKKQIRIPRKLRKIPIFATSFYHRIAMSVF